MGTFAEDKLDLGHGSSPPMACAWAACFSFAVAFALAMVLVGGGGCRRQVVENGGARAGTPAEECMEQEPQTNQIEILTFKPRLAYLDAGDSNFVVEFFAQYCQVSTNFFSYDFARNAENNSIENVRIHFLGRDGTQLLTVPCVVEGQDMAWAMDGTRIVQLYGSFILTRERCENLKGLAAKLCVSDGRGNLLDGQGGIIEYDMTANDVSTLILNPLSKMGRGSN